MRYVFVLLSAAVLCLSGCVSQNEVALSKDVYRIDIDAQGMIGVGAARQGFDKRISNAVRSKGYTHYKILAYGSQNGSVYAGNTPVYSNTNVNVFGNTAYGTTTVYGGQPIHVPTSQTSVVIQMFKAPNIPGDAIEALVTPSGASKAACKQIKLQGETVERC